MTLDERIKERAQWHGRKTASAAIGKEFEKIYAVVYSRRVWIGDRLIHLDDVFKVLEEELAQKPGEERIRAPGQ